MSEPAPPGRVEFLRSKYEQLAIAVKAELRAKRICRVRGSTGVNGLGPDGSKVLQQINGRTGDEVARRVLGGEVLGGPA